MKMTADQLQAAADFYGITLEEARMRHAKCVDQADNPGDPICIGCARRPFEIQAYIDATQEDPDNPVPTTDDVRWYVISSEGTYNSKNGHYLCDECYILNGQPSSDRGWVAP